MKKFLQTALLALVASNVYANSFLTSEVDLRRAKNESFYLENIEKKRKVKYIDGPTDRQIYNFNIYFEGHRINSLVPSSGVQKIGLNKPEHIAEFNQTCKQFQEVKDFVAKNYTADKFKKDPDSFNAINIEFYKKYAKPFLRAFKEQKVDLTFCNIRQDLLPFTSNKMRQLFKGTKYEPFYLWFLEHQDEVTNAISNQKFSDSYINYETKKRSYIRLNPNWEL